MGRILGAGEDGVVLTLPKLVPYVSLELLGNLCHWQEPRSSIQQKTYDPWSVTGSERGIEGIASIFCILR